MKPFLLLLTLYVSASAAPLPPLLPVKRPAPLLSPKHASAPKVSPMVKATTFQPASVTAASCTVINDHNFFGCNTNDPGCVLYDVIQVSFPAMSGAGVTIEMCEDIGGGWIWVGRYGAAPYVRDVGFGWHRPVDQRTKCGFFRLVATPTAAFATASGQVMINQNFKGVSPWTRPRK